MEDTHFINDKYYVEEPDKSMVRRKRKVLLQTSLYTDECVSLLQQAVNEVGTGPETRPKASKSRYASSSDEDNAEGGYDSGEQSDESSSSDNADTQSQKQLRQDATPVSSNSQTTASTIPKREPKIQVKLENLLKRQSDIQARKYVDTLTCHNFQLREPHQSALCLPTVLLSKDDRVADHPLYALKSYQELVNNLRTAEKTVIVFFVRSGRFAGAVFSKGECVQHRTTTRYTVRKGQGKAQSAQDSQRRPKSIGSQLRRQGEEKLREDIAEAALNWKAYIDRAALILISCPRTMKKDFYQSLEGVISREDDRVRRVPLDLGRPTFENAVLIHDVLTTVTVREMIVPLEECKNNDANEETKAEKEQQGKNQSQSTNKTETVTEKEDIIIPLSALHVACKNGDLEVIRDILTTSMDELKVMAGPDLMTPLHYAAASSETVDPSMAADCVTELLIKGRADPTVLDARSRPSYFLAAHDRVRDAFRMARATLGEDYCAWDEAKVGPPLTADDLQQRKDKEAEKRKKKKARQKQKKAQDKAAAEELEQRQKEEEEKARQAEEAKRIRDGLQPKTNTATNVCDFCQTVCKGRKRSQMFKRLEYAYCSTECVQNHKRELMAKAALSRFGSSS